MASTDPPAIGRTVLVGVDGSPESADAALLGRRLADAARGSLRLVTAASEALAQVAATRAGLDASGVQAALLDAARARATAGLEEHFDASDLAETLLARLGPPDRVIADTGRELGADLLVLGGHRRGRPQSWLQKGTAQRLLRSTESPVLVTGPDAPRIDRVIAAVDRSFAAAPTVAAARRVATLLDVPLQAIHVVAEPTVPSAVTLDLDVDALVRAEKAKAQTHIRALLPPDADLAILEGEEVIPSLLGAVDQAPPALLVVGAQGRGWIHRLVVGSTTQALLAELPTSLMIVPSSPPKSTTDH